MQEDFYLAIPPIIEAEDVRILDGWLTRLKQSSGGGWLNIAEVERQARQFLLVLRRALAAGTTDISAPAFLDMRDLLTEISTSRAIQGSSAGETGRFIVSSKQPILDAMRRVAPDDVGKLSEAGHALTSLIDEFEIFTFEVFQKTRDDVILRQQREIAELSTPVVKLWDRILALPLIGTLDSERTQVVMENLLQSIVDEGAEIAIIDITGVPTVDTLVAQHLLKTVAAARLMGADCIISGIRAQIAQTMVHLGVELNVVSKASLADAFAVALGRMGKAVVMQKALI